MLTDQLQNDLKQAQLTRDEIKVSTLRLLLSEIHNTKIQKGGDVSNQDVISVIQREVKKREEAAAGFRQGGKEEQALKEETEQKILEEYLPAQMSSEELTKLIESSINEIGASSIQDMGRVMSLVMSKVAGRADGGKVSVVVKQKLSQ